MTDPVIDPTDLPILARRRPTTPQLHLIGAPPARESAPTPSSDPGGASYNVSQCVIAIGGGGLVFLALYLAYRSRPVFVPTNEVDPLAPYRMDPPGPRTGPLTYADLVRLTGGTEADVA